MTELTAVQHLTRAENIYRRFGATNPLLPAEHSAFLTHITEALKGKWTPQDRKDMLSMLETVVLYMGIPGAIHGKHPLFNGTSTLDIFAKSPRNGNPMRDFDGRWNMHPDMLERGQPVMIIWQHEEDREWELNQEYVEAFRASVGYGSMVA